MNEYTKRLAKAALRFTGKPVTLSPMVYDSQWEYERSQLSSDPVDFRVILNVSSLGPSEVKVLTDGAGVQVHMEHDSRELAKDFKLSRSCTYSYKMPDTSSTANLAAYWTEDQFLIIQPRGDESVFKEGCHEFHLLPIRLINVLNPCLDDKCLTESLGILVKKTRETYHYVRDTTEISQKKDILSLLKSIPIYKENDVTDLIKAAREEQEKISALIASTSKQGEDLTGDQSENVSNVLEESVEQNGKSKVPQEYISMPESRVDDLDERILRSGKKVSDGSQDSAKDKKIKQTKKNTGGDATPLKGSKRK